MIIGIKNRKVQHTRRHISTSPLGPDPRSLLASSCHLTTKENVPYNTVTEEM